MSESGLVILPTDVRPLKYRLTLEPDLEKFTFDGRVSIDVEVVTPTTSVTLNCTEIAIQSCRLTPGDGAAMTPRATTFDESRETVTFEFDSAVPTGRASLDIEFTGELNDKLRGFYRSRYTDSEGRERYLATTQMEATDARRAFPCWDEPNVKASFQVTLVVPSDLVAVSNMSVESETDAPGGLKSISYAETPVMSTYLLAFVVGDLASIERMTDSGTLIRIWATRGKEEQGRFALETSVRLLAYFNDYFGIPFPLPKLDHLAIPDFAAGAMENWGAITYRETALLVDPENSSVGTRMIVAAIVSHEMAHMWFGDLVTMDWWNDLWLNESFASWIGDKAVDNLFPEWEVWTQFIASDTNRGLSLDGLKNSHPIEQEVNNPAEIGQLFDAISYSKGATILRMLESFLGAEKFRQGLRDYLIRHQYANARTQDLWDALGEASGEPVGTIMDTWVKQTGYPVLDVAVSRHRDGIDVALSQRRFVYEDILGEGEADDTLWQVPVSVRTASRDQSGSILMAGPEATTRVTPGAGGASDEWVKLNPDQTAFYRVKYASEELDRLTGPIENLELPTGDRLGLQNDAYALARAGHIPATQFLTMAEAYKNETDAAVCADLATNLGGMDTLLWDQPFYPRFEELARSIFQPIGARMGWDAKPGERHLDALLRSTALGQLGSYGDEDTISEARTRFDQYVEDPARVHPDIRRVVLSLAAKKGDSSAYEMMWGLEKKANLQEEQSRLLLALTSFEQPDLLRETLRRSLTDDVRVHDTISVVTSVAGNRHGRDLAWEFLKDNWAEFDRRYSEGGFGLMRLVSMVSGFTTPEMSEDVERFFTDHPAPAAERSIRQSLERIQINIAWLDRNRTELAARFAG
jgi:puromycin-sensitive aminopeptidase